MIEIMSVNFQDFILYTTYVTIFFYFIFMISYQWLQFYSYHHQSKPIDPLYLILSKNDYELLNERGDSFLTWLPKTIRRKESGKEDKPDGLFFFNLTK